MVQEKSLFENSNGLEGFLRNGKNFDFDSTLCKILKELTFNYETEGAYSKHVLVCRIEDNIEMIKKHCKNEKDAETYFYMCFPAIAFITRKIEMPVDFMLKHNVQPWHESLIRRTYFDLNTGDKQWSYTDSDSEIYLGDKRPFGNSDVTGDIAEEYFTYNDKEITHKGKTFKWNDDEDDHKDFDIYDYRYEWSNENGDFFWNIMDETIEIIKHMLKEIDVEELMLYKKESTAFNHYTECWEIDARVKERNKKIEKLVENE